MSSSSLSSSSKTIIEQYMATFKEGTAVEVSSEDSGLRGSWYTATVKQPISPTTLKILVEYHSLMTDDTCTYHLRELVDAILIRPISPLDPGREFRVMEDVDAFHNDGWWEGVVVSVDVVRKRYSVFFRCSREQIEFAPANLRLHREWLGGNNWNPPLVSASSTRPTRRRGKDGDDGGRSTGGSGQKKRREGGRRSVHSPTKQGGAGGPGVVMNNGENRERMHNSKPLVCALRMQNQSVRSNGVTRMQNQSVRTRASNHTGGRASRS